MEVQSIFSAPDVKTLVQFIVLNYACDFFVLGGAVYLYNKGKQFVSKRFGKAQDAEKEAVALLEEVIRGDKKSAEELVKSLSRKIEERVANELRGTVREMLGELREEIKELRKVIAEAVEAKTEEDEERAEKKAVEMVNALLNKVENLDRVMGGGEERKEEEEPLIIKIMDKMWSNQRMLHEMWSDEPPESREGEHHRKRNLKNR